MITFNGKKLNNLEEQVQWLTEVINSITSTGQVVSEFGIKVQGVLPSWPTPAPTASEYGEAYLVGPTSPYNMYIWTKGATTDLDAWLNLGQFPAPSTVPGPQGNPGKGISSITQNTPYISGSQTVTPITINFSDSTTSPLLITSSNGSNGTNGQNGTDGVSVSSVTSSYVGEDNGYSKTALNITLSNGNTTTLYILAKVGQQGQQGPAFNILGHLSSTLNLPTPTAQLQDEGAAYTINENAQGQVTSEKHVWVIQGTNGSFIWTDLGISGIQGPQGPQGNPGADGVISSTQASVSGTQVTFKGNVKIPAINNLLDQYGNQLLPYASSSAYGRIKVDGTTIIANNGVISAASSGGTKLYQHLFYNNQMDDNAHRLIIISKSSTAYTTLSAIQGDLTSNKIISMWYKSALDMYGNRTPIVYYYFNYSDMELTFKYYNGSTLTTITTDTISGGTCHDTVTAL